MKRQMLNALKRGTGEAYLIVKNNPKIDFSNQIIKGALNIFAYDAQCEGNRAQYIFDIISICPQKDKIRNAVLQGLATEQNNTWNLTHLFALTKLFAAQGDAAAKQSIYDRFLNNSIEGSDWAGYVEILELDGLNGLFYITEKFGKYIEQNPDDWQDDSIIAHFQAENKDIKVQEELENKAETNKFIRIYLDNIAKTNASQESYKAKPTQYKGIIDEVLNRKPFISFIRKMKMTNKEVNQIAKQLLEKTKASNIAKFLDIFGLHKFPYDSQIILDFAKRKPKSKYKIAENAMKALKHLKGKDIRNFVLDKIQNAKNPIDYLEMLLANYEKGDFKLLSDIANRTNNEHEVERLASIYTDIYEANRTKECKEPLEILYNKMNCAIHRNSIVQILIENKVLSDKIKNEIEFDCDLRTRKLAK
jgi:hypothetical protein